MALDRRIRAMTRRVSVVLVSPHLDDGVLSCGELLAGHPGACLVTVFAGRPGPMALTGWDRDCGFSAGDDVVGARRAEDRAACEVLGATAVWLDFLDAQYGNAPPVDAPSVDAPPLDTIVRSLRDVVDRERPDAIYIPLGL